jgi:hypothetical protein
LNSFPEKEKGEKFMETAGSNRRFSNTIACKMKMFPMYIQSVDGAICYNYMQEK